MTAEPVVPPPQLFGGWQDVRDELILRGRATVEVTEPVGPAPAGVRIGFSAVRLSARLAQGARSADAVLEAWQRAAEIAVVARPMPWRTAKRSAWTRLSP